MDYYELEVDIYERSWNIDAGRHSCHFVLVDRHMHMRELLASMLPLMSVSTSMIHLHLNFPLNQTCITNALLVNYYMLATYLFSALATMQCTFSFFHLTTHVTYLTTHVITTKKLLLR